MQDIDRPYTRSGEKLRTAISLVDRVVILDNTKSKHRLIARIEKSKILRVSKRLANWIGEFPSTFKKSSVSRIAKFIQIDQFRLFMKKVEYLLNCAFSSLKKYLDNPLYAAKRLGYYPC